MQTVWKTREAEERAAAMFMEESSRRPPEDMLEFNDDKKRSGRCLKKLSYI